MILLLDNYDSFTWNLVDFFRVLGNEPNVIRNDEFTLDEVLQMSFSAVVISPGPGRPEDSGILMPFLREIYGKVPVLGICLGMQAIGLLEGAKLVKAPEPTHGKGRLIFHDGKSIFSNIPSPFQACRYHSLILKDVPSDALQVIAASSDDLPMAIHSLRASAWGVQFHPEAVLTAHGMQILSNWLNATGLKKPIKIL